MSVVIFSMALDGLGSAHRISLKENTTPWLFSMHEYWIHPTGSRRSPAVPPKYRSDLAVPSIRRKGGLLTM